MSWSKGPYEGEVIGTVGGYELRQLTEDELRHAGAPRYRIVGLSHWNPASFFKRYADELAGKAEVHRLAGEFFEALPKGSGL